MDEDGFTLVKKGKNRKRISKKNNNTTASISERRTFSPPPSPNRFRTQIEKLKQQLIKTPLYLELIKTIPITISYLVCYGLGNLKLSRSQFQLALLSALLDHFPNIISKFCYDPCHCKEEQNLIEEISGLEYISTNEFGKREIDMTCEIVLYYMPHCDRWLYCNVLQNHHNQLKRVYFLGNSFMKYSISDDTKESDEINSVVTSSICLEMNFSLKTGQEDECGIVTSTKLFEAFNDIRFISFKENKYDDEFKKVHDFVI